MPTRLLEALALSAAGDVMAAWLRISSAALMPTSDATETPHAPAPHQPATTPSRNKPQPAAFHRLERRKSEEHTSELQSLMRISYAVFCLKKKKDKTPKYQSAATIK